MAVSGGDPSHDRDRRARAEAALHSGDPSYQLIVDTIPALINTMTAEGELEHVNRQVLEYFGRTFEELKQWGTRDDFVHPDDLPRVMAAWRHALTTGLPAEIEHRMRRADGVYRWFQVRAVPLRDDDDRIVRWYVLMSDVDALKESGARLQSLLQEIERLKDRFQDENLALREEIDQASMFEEIVGSSRALKSTLLNVSKVAPTDSTVLISGGSGPQPHPGFVEVFA
jgi:formate hydrogenlyase transcriptional activator